MINATLVLKASKKLIIFALLLAIIAPVATNSKTAAIDKVTVEELVAKHLQSLGTDEARAAVGSRVMVGVSHVTFRVDAVGQAEGKAVMASDGVKNLFTVVFASKDYPYEKVGYDGKKVTAAQLRPSQYSNLGNFLLAHGDVLKEGLLGGTLSSAWPLLDLKTRSPHLKYAGTTKVDNRNLYKLEYIPRNGSDLKINIFLDGENFQHVRTDYQQTISAQMGTSPETSGRETATTYRMTEEFSDFKKEGGLNLPHNYKLRLTIETKGKTFQGTWDCDLSQFIFNKAIDVKEFNMATQ
jgi:hypothetical protein